MATTLQSIENPDHSVTYKLPVLVDRLHHAAHPSRRHPNGSPSNTLTAEPSTAGFRCGTSTLR